MTLTMFLLRIKDRKNSWYYIKIIIFNKARQSVFWYHKLYLDNIVRYVYDV